MSPTRIPRYSCPSAQVSPSGNYYTQSIFVPYGTPYMCGSPLSVCVLAHLPGPPSLSYWAKLHRNLAPLCCDDTLVGYAVYLSH